MPDLITMLLDEIDPLPHRDRMRVVALRVRALAGTADLDALLTGLRAGEPFHRRLAVFAAAQAGHREALRAAPSDPDPGVRAAAVAAWLRRGGPTVPELWDLLADAPATVRRLAYRLVRSEGLSALADGVIDRVRERFGDAEAARILPGCTEATVARVLPQLGAAVVNWTALGRRHPEAVLAEADRQLGAVAPPDRWWSRFGGGVWAAAPRHPARVLDLLERHAPAASLPGVPAAYGVLAAADPRRTLRLLTDPERARTTGRWLDSRALRRRLAVLDPADLAPLAAMLNADPLSSGLSVLLKAVPPARREALWDAAHAGLAAPTFAYDEVLDVLPYHRRVAEARRLMAVSDAEDAADGRPEGPSLYYGKYLPWPEAEPLLLDELHHPDPDRRGHAWAELIHAATLTRDPAVVTGVAERLGTLRHERDPVRAIALNVFGHLAPPLVEAAAADALDRVAADALDAPDCSPRTREVLQGLAVEVLRAHAGTPELTGWALRVLARLYSGDSLPRLAGLGDRLRRGQEEDLFAALRPVLAAGQARGEHGLLLAVAAGLGRRAWCLAPLQAMLGDLVHARVPQAVAVQAIELWLADPRTRRHRVGKVLRADSSAVTVGVVWRTLCSTRTDLLDRVLGDEPPAGRFLATGARWTPAAAHRLDRWLPRQHRAYAALLRRTAGDAGLDVRRRAAAIRAAAAVPQAGWAVVERYLGSPNAALAEAALDAAARADRPEQALTVLLSRVGGDGARAVVRAAGRCAAALPPSALGLALAGALDGAKVTARKEILRLAARFAVPDAGALLLAQWRHPDTHPDVRTAAVAAARQRTGAAYAWEILGEAVDGTAEDASMLLGADPYALAPADRGRYGALVVRCCLRTDAKVERVCWAALRHWAPWTPGAAAVLLTRITDLRGRYTWQQAVQALVAEVHADRGGDVLVAALSRLADLDAADDDRDPYLDRPAWDRIAHIVDGLTSGHPVPPPGQATLLTQAGAALLAHEDHLASGLRLLLYPALRTGEDLLPRLRDTAVRLADRPAAAADLRGWLADQVNRLGRHRAAGAAEAALAAARDLAAEPGLSSGLIAVGLAHNGQWDPVPWRDVVHALRRHLRADVRSAARAVRLVAY